MALQSSDQQTPARPIAARLVTVEAQQETDLVTGERSERIFVKLYAAARTSGLMAAISDRDWKTLCTVATYMNQDGFCFPSQDELARALGCTRQTANERIQSLAKFRFQGNPVFCVVPSKRTRKGTWTRNGYQVLPISSLRIYDRPGENTTVSATPDMGAQAPMSAFTVSANPDTNKNQLAKRENRSTIDRSHDQWQKTNDDERGSGSHPAVPDQSVSQPIRVASDHQSPAEAPEPIEPFASSPGLKTSRSGAAVTSPEDSSDPSAPSPSYLVARERILQTRQRLAATMSMERSRGAPDRSPVQPPAAAPQPVHEERPSRGRPPGTSEERDRLRAYLTDFMLELHDEASLPASITRAVNLFKQANIPPARWDDYLYQARTITQEHSGSIKKARSQNTGSLAVKNKAPYFFAVLANLIAPNGAGSPPPLHSTR